MTDDLVRRLRSARASMLGTDDEDTYWACHDAANEIKELHELLACVYGNVALLGSIVIFVFAVQFLALLTRL